MYLLYFTCNFFKCSLGVNSIEVLYIDVFDIFYPGRAEIGSVIKVYLENEIEDFRIKI